MYFMWTRWHVKCPSHGSNLMSDTNLNCCYINVKATVTQGKTCTERNTLLLVRLIKSTL